MAKKKARMSAKMFILRCCRCCWCCCGDAFGQGSLVQLVMWADNIGVATQCCCLEINTLPLIIDIPLCLDTGDRTMPHTGQLSATTTTRYVCVAQKKCRSKQRQSQLLLLFLLLLPPDQLQINQRFPGPRSMLCLNHDVILILPPCRVFTKGYHCNQIHLWWKL